jgi:2OG-Fe(II) oxygenase superfamily
MFVNDVELSEGEYIFPAVKVIDNAIDNSQELIDIANSIPDAWSHSAVGPEGIIDDEVRRSNYFPFPVHFNNPLAFFKTAQKIFLYAHHYAQENGMEFSHMEPISMLEYLSGDGFYKAHTDFGPTMPRSISAILYLNDVEDGGETYFNEIDLTIEPREGRLVIFPSTFPFAHEARLPKSGNKYVLVTWFGLLISPEAMSNYYGWNV